MSRLLTILGILLWLIGLAALAGGLKVGTTAETSGHEIFAAILFLNFVSGLGLGALCLAAAWFVPRFERLRKKEREEGSP